MSGPRCLRPPPGWSCSRDVGHDGPCAASEEPWPTEFRSADDVALALGLLPFAEFEFDQMMRLAERTKHLTRDEAVRERYRQTGRSTRIMCEALVFVSRGRTVEMKSHNYGMTRLMFNRARDFAEHLRFDTRCVRSWDAGTGIRRDGPMVFVDHPLP